MANVIKKSSLSIRVTPGLIKDLKSLASIESRTLADYVRLLLINHVKAKKEEK